MTAPRRRHAHSLALEDARWVQVAVMALLLIVASAAVLPGVR
jgi:hypothetical protein